MAIKTGKWDDANDLSNELENFVVTAAGNIDEDNVLFPVDPFDAIGDALNVYLNSQGNRYSNIIG